MSSPKTLNIKDFHIEQIEHMTKQNYELIFNQVNLKEGIIPVNILKGTERGSTLVILAGVHGDEYEGIQTIIQIFRDINPSDIRGTLVMIPVTNVSSFYAGTRTSDIDGQNLARSFPGNPQGSYTSKLAWYIKEVFISKADFLLDLHSGGTHYAMPAMVGYYNDSNSEVGRKSKAAAEAFGMNVIWGHEQIGPGRTISTALDYEVPWLYTEGYGGKRVKIEEQRQFKLGVYRLLNHLDMLVDPHRWIKEPLGKITYRLRGDGNLDNATTAHTDGFFIPSVKLLDTVRTGDEIGVIYDWYGNQLQVVTTNVSGIVMMLRETPFTTAGDGLFMVADVEH
jgi:predicted deacylase